MDKFDYNKKNIAKYDYRLSGGKEIVFPSLSELIKFVQSYDTTDCYFRGQSGLWDIASSLYRHYGTPQWEDALFICDTVYKWLKKNSYINRTICDDNSILAVAQHYGCPTDLVDITSNFMTACYFASSEDSEHDKNLIGCVWIFTPSDLDLMRMVMEIYSEGTFDEVSEEIMAQLEETDYNQLIEVDLPELSRLNAQQGSFLWDLGGVLNSQIIKNHIGIRLSFHHTNGERTLFKEYEKILFPFPNQLEVEIMRILKEKSRSNGLPQYYGLINIASLEKKGILSNGVPKEFVNKSTQKIQIENPNYFVPSFGGYEWEKYLIKNEKYNPVTIDLSKCTECIMQLIFDNVLELVDHIITAIETGEVYDYLVMIIHDEQLYEFYDQKFLIDIINTLNHYEYSKNEIANVLLECLKIGIFKQSNNYEYRSKMLKDYYQCTVTKLETVSDMILIHFYLPSNYEFLDELCKNEFNYFDKSSVHLSEFEKVYLDSVAENTKILMYQNCPSKIISYQAMRDMFVKFILPQQFLFSNPEERIYLPDYLQNFGFSVSGRTHYVVSNSSKDLPLGSITTFELPFSES